MRLCPFCGYSLGEIPTDVCPECGERVTPEDFPRARPRRLEWVAVAGLMVSGFVLSMTGVLSVVGIPMILLGIAVIGTPGGVGPRYRRFLTIAAVISWLPALAGGVAALLWLVGQAGLFP